MKKYPILIVSFLAILAVVSAASADSEVLRSIYRLEVTAEAVGHDADGVRHDPITTVSSCGAFAIDEQGALLTSEHCTAPDLIFPTMIKNLGADFAKLRSVDHVDISYRVYDRRERYWRLVLRLLPKMFAVDLARTEGYRSPVVIGPDGLEILRSNRQLGVTVLRIGRKTMAMPLATDRETKKLDRKNPVRIYGYWQLPPWKMSVPQGRISGQGSQDVKLSNDDSIGFGHLILTASAIAGHSGGPAVQNGKVIGLIKAADEKLGLTFIIPVWDLNGFLK